MFYAEHDINVRFLLSFLLSYLVLILDVDRAGNKEVSKYYVRKQCIDHAIDGT